MASSQPINLTRFAWLSIGAAVVTISMKVGAYYLTNSVGLLSDALESVVNLVSAIVALLALRVAARPADEEYTYGYSKVEFFSSGFEGGMILIAAVSIAVTAIPRLLNPQPLEQVGLGLLISVLASLVNFAVSRVLFSAGKRYESITLQADARHLMTDVITTGGVLIAIVLVAITGLVRLDPLIALAVAANIVFTGIRLLRQSYLGLMDASLPADEVGKIQEVLGPYKAKDIKFHAVHTRSAASRAFVSMHILVPGQWTIQHGHDTAESIERDVRSALPKLMVFTHVEPMEDPSSLADTYSDHQ